MFPNQALPPRRLAGEHLGVGLREAGNNISDHFGEPGNCTGFHQIGKLVQRHRSERITGPVGTNFVRIFEKRRKGLSFQLVDSSGRT
ncbi:hypothetical protein D3C87_2070420 [compost metagenome]